MQAFYNGMSLVGSLVVMAAAIALAYYGSRWYAGKVSASGMGRHIRIVDRVMISPGCSVVIVQAGDGFYLLGVSEKNIQMLCELPDFDPGSPCDAVNQAAFGQLFQKFINRAKTSENDGGSK